MTLVVAVALSSLALVGTNTSASVAAMPPRYYPYNQILWWAHTPKGDIPVRRGYWDSVSKSGFGFDKIFWHHDLWNRSTISTVLTGSSSIDKVDAGTYVKYVWLQIRDVRTKRVYLEQKVRAVVILNRAVNVKGYQTSSPAGLFTMYCDYGDPSRTKCPDWVNTAQRATSKVSNPAGGDPALEPTPDISAAPTTTEAAPAVTLPDEPLDEFGAPTSAGPSVDAVRPKYPAVRPPGYQLPVATPYSDGTEFVIDTEPSYVVGGAGGVY
ncbi:hypothetical protein GCM10011512_07710 [Tersicoccus solisilvae]|uniref:Uncharacterized protein n=1 Tax=Tersicoccus solisilvae TaxID=1882339 RepID=A0ABQ1NUR1_9MICC|nr:hypothetical protein GCM10011512_07710 [Tersicoccus solisilvae]